MAASDITARRRVSYFRNKYGPAGKRYTSGCCHSELDGAAEAACSIGEAVTGIFEGVS